MSTSLRQLTNRIEDLYIENPQSAVDVPTPPSRRIKSIGTPNSLSSSPVPSTSRLPATPPVANMALSATSASPLLRLSTGFPTEMAVKERDTSTEEETITYHAHTSFANSLRASRACSYNPKHWRTSGTFRAEELDKAASLQNPIEDHLYHRGYLNGVCSDISINAFGKSYFLHRIILDRSPFFSSLFAGPWQDSDVPVLNLDFTDPNITQLAFDIALQRLYGHVVTSEESIATSLLATGAYLGLQDLVEECLTTLLQTLNSRNVSMRYEFARAKQYYGEESEKLAEACYTLLCHAGSSMPLELWDGIPNDVAAEAISSDAFWVEGEYERYCYVRDFINRRRSQGCDDLQVLEQVLVSGIHYLHLPFDTLQQILVDKVDGNPVVPSGVIHHALWQQTSLRQVIVTADPVNPSLNLAADDGWSIPSKDTMTDPFNSEEDTEIIPVVPEKMGSDVTSPVQETEDIINTSSPYPPFRFSVEVSGIRALTEGDKFYSRTVFYAGSYWRLYVQKKRSKRPYLGFYLQRRDHKILPHLVRDASINRLMGTLNGDDIFSAAATGLEYESTLLYNATVRGGRKSLYKHRQSSSEPEEESKRNSLARQGLGYIDERAKVLTYFKLWCSPGSATSSGVGMRQYNSKPDTFNLSQSWGWKSNTLCVDEKKESNEDEDDSKDVIRFTVALGNV